ncbi:hypothetical protein [Ruania rhizosphaerae]|uniref:hypothetical protein n=1 Tax=Ruania rhizosphaerae TaxID=1840413 RepID=UPI0013576EF2|nr:hypothetical protein [Ruania rhizosphaerae]
MTHGADDSSARTGNPVRGSVEAHVLANLGLLASLRPQVYEPHHEVLKRELDVVRLEEAARRQGLESIRMDPLVRVLQDESRALGFFKNMSSRVLYLDRATTNRKHLTRRILARHDIPLARGLEARDADGLVEAFRAIGPPVVVKPVTGSGGTGVVTDITSLDQAHAAAAPVLAAGRGVLVEEMVHGVDLRISVLEGRSVAATLRVPANVVGDGRSTIAELVAAKNELRSQSDYLRHQPIILSEEKDRFLAHQGLTPASILPAGQRVLLHHVANLSAGGDSYEVHPFLHPEITALAERAASFFSSSLHAGVDILLERLDAPLDEQRAVVCEVNLNNEMPMHVYPMYGTPVPLDELELAAHWRVESTIPAHTLREESAPGAVTVHMDEVTELARPSYRPPAPSPSDGHALGATLRSLDNEYLLATFRSIDTDAEFAIPEGGLIHRRDGGNEQAAERYDRTVLAGEVGRNPSVMHRYARASGIRVMARHRLRSGQQERALELAGKPWRHWLLHTPRADGSTRTVRIESGDQLEEHWAAVEKSRATMVETPFDPACVLLMDATTLLAAQLRVPLTIVGDGRTGLGELVEHHVAARRAHAPLASLTTRLNTPELLTSRHLDPGTVPAEGEQVQIGRSPMLSDGAATVGLNALPWPGLAELAARFVGAIGSDGVATVAFVPRRRDATNATWALWRYHSEPPLALFHSPLHGPGYDPYPAIARRVLQGPTRELAVI